ncbi:MAG: carboxypeptidase regulatory-like domain-containing protein [Acidobacteria bacterium]|nr:carboxypeptidase regulatory-like domain-containing protein [Acidobacteriota bacterium]
MKRLLTIALAVAGTCPAQGPAGEPRGEIGGTVKSAKSGELLKSVQVFLRLSSNSAGPRSTTTGPAGDFLFANLYGADYSLYFRKAGYRALEGEETRVTLKTDQQVSGLDIKLWPAGAISGRVLDSDGEPVPEAEARAYAVVHRRGGASLMFAGRARSNDVGEYRIYDLPAGKYLVLVWPPGEGVPAGEHYASMAAVYYPNGSSPSEAMPVTINWGQELTRLNLELSDHRTYHIAGAVFDAATGGPCSDCVIQAARVDRRFFVTLPNTPRVSSKGFFVIRGLSPGVYKIIARRPGDGEFISRRLVEITNRNLNDIVLVAGPGQTVSGQIVFGDLPQGIEIPRMTVSVSALAAPQSWPERDGDVKDDLTFRIEQVPAETYRFEVSPLPRGGYVKAWRVSGQELPGPELMIREDGPLSRVEAVIAFDGATVTGWVKPSRPASGDHPIEARVALIPRENQSPYLVDRYASTDPGGSFSFQAVPAGAYTLFALPRQSTAELLDPDVRRALQAYGGNVKLEPRDKVSVELALAPDPE